MSNLIPIEYKTQRVLTTQQLAEAYNTQPKNIRMNYSNNVDKFTEGVHYFKLEGGALREFKNRVTESSSVAESGENRPTGGGQAEEPDLNRANIIGSVGKNVSSLMLWSHRGCSRHCKLLDTDKSWTQ